MFLGCWVLGGFGCFSLFAGSLGILGGSWVLSCVIEDFLCILGVFGVGCFWVFGCFRVFSGFMLGCGLCGFDFQLWCGFLAWLDSWDFGDFVYFMFLSLFGFGIVGLTLVGSGALALSLVGLVD